MREMIRAAFVIARRDFSATVLSRTFLLFLLGPLLPGADGPHFRRRHRADRRGGPPDRCRDRPCRRVPAARAARNRLQDTFGAIAMVNLQRIEPTGEPQQAARVLQSQKPAFARRARRRPRPSADDRDRPAAERDGQADAPVHRRGAADPPASGAAVNLPVLLTSPSPTAPSRRRRPRPRMRARLCCFS